MKIRIVEFIEQTDDYKLLGCMKVDNISEMLKTLDYMKKSEIPLTINTNDIIDTEGEEYYIDSISMIVPTLGGEISECITVYVV